MSATVLVVDDSATIRAMVSDVLAQAGFTIEEARDGVEGRERIDAGGIDCVICDVNMPNKNGIEMVQEVKSDPANTGLPIVMLTTEGGAELIQQARAAGASGWVVKPFKPDMLLAAVRRLIAAV